MTARLTPAEQLRVLLAMVDGTTLTDQHDGTEPPERVVADADLEWLADREEAREQRWRGVA